MKLSLRAQHSYKGFTLLEMTLVLVVISAILVMVIGYVTQKSSELRRDRLSLQLQQILNAALAFYVDRGTWPVPCGTGSGSGGCGNWSDLTTLQEAGYLLPSTLNLVSPWGQSFCISCNDTADSSSTPHQPNGTFSVRTRVPNPSEAIVVAGRMPFGFVTDEKGANTSPPVTSCPQTPTANCTTVVSSVTVPGQSISNARSINYAGIFNNGACVPAPVCPGNMRPQIFVTPSQVSGNWDAANPNAVYPIESFSAFARGKNYAGEPGLFNEIYDCSVVTTPPGPSGGGNVRACHYWSGQHGNPVVPKPGETGGDPANTRYWRVCLSIVTERGRIIFPQPGQYDAGIIQGRNMGTVIAFTRCVPVTSDGKAQDTPSGSPFGYFEPNHSSNP